MKKLIIKEIDNYLYILFDKSNNKYQFNMEFLDVEIKPKINDYIYMSDELLNKNYKEYSDVYTFGDLKSNYGRKIENENNSDLIVLEIDAKKYYLKRLYG